MQRFIIFITALFLCFPAKGQNKDHIIANPLNLNYRFMTNEPGRREAADPVLEYFNWKYYLFASKSGDYWSSPDLADGRTSRAKASQRIPTATIGNPSTLSSISG